MNSIVVLIFIIGLVFNVIKRNAEINQKRSTNQRPNSGQRIPRQEPNRRSVSTTPTPVYTAKDAYQDSRVDIQNINLKDTFERIETQTISNEERNIPANNSFVQGLIWSEILKEPRSKDPHPTMGYKTKKKS